ncbi:MAG: FtsH protease activity modulator HflK [Alphaproteobacteria bacterium]|nr:FtsH protease activity modulator HflK [Alphaproteobacteria bacterium]
MTKKINVFNVNPWDTSDEKISKAKVVDFTTKIAKMQNSKDDFNGFYKIILGILAFLWLASGFYQVQPSEEGVVLRLGKYIETTKAGLHYHLPYPFEEVYIVDVSKERSINLGVNESSYGNRSNVNELTESHMLTGDENIVDINLTVVWNIKDAKDFLFKTRTPESTVRVAAQSVLREIIGQSKMEDIITGDRDKIENDTKEELQKLLNDFETGVNIVRVKLQKADPPRQVVDAFNEVQRAKTDAERFKNEAEAYANEILPKAQGEAIKRKQEAEAYKVAAISKAEGEAKRFSSVYNAYKNGKLVTSKRLYIETIEDVLKKTKNVIMEPGQKSSNMMPIVPLK